MSASAASPLLLLCLDLQPPFLKAMSDPASLQRRCSFAIQAAAGFGIPVCFTEQVPEKLGETARELVNLMPTAPRLPKRTFSALGDETIRSTIVGQTTEHLLLCGLETPVCVYQTALDALTAGLQVTLLSDCLGARRIDDARTCLDALVRAGAHVLPSETVFYSMLHDVEHPFFRGYTQLVKAHAP